MKSIIVKNENGVKAYMSGFWTGYKEDGTSYEIKKTEEEELQECYQHLIDDIKDQEFEKNLIALLGNHFRKEFMENWTNIQIKMSYSDGKQLERNIYNKENRQWQKIDSIELPEENLNPAPLE